MTVRPNVCSGKLHIFLSLLILFFAASPSFGTERPVAEWNFIVYVAAANTLDQFAVEDLRKMAEVGSTSRVNVLVEVARSKERDRSWTGDRRFRLTKDHPFGDAATVQLGQINTGDPKALLDFVRWSSSEYPAKHQALIIWNHGSGWRAAQIRQLEQDAANSQGVAFKAIAFDERTKDRLYQSQLETALRELHDNGVHLDLVGFDACLMSMLEVWYGIRDVASVGVGSEDLEPGYGWPYDDLLRKLTTNPEMDAELLGTAIVDAYSQSITQSSSIARRKDPFTLAAVRLAAISKIADALTRFTTSVSADKDVQGVLRARAKVRAFAFDAKHAWPNGIDLESFARKMSESDNPLATKTASSLLADSVTSAVIENRFSENRRDFDPHGISIYFPASSEIWDHDPEGKAYTKTNIRFPPAFVREHGWSDFLSAAYGDRPLGLPENKEKPQAKTRITDSPRVDGCSVSGLDLNQLNHRFKVIESHYAVVLSPDWRAAVTIILRRYCEAKLGQPRVRDSEIESLVNATEVSQVGLYYTAIRIICENDEDIPSGLDLRDAILRHLAKFDPKTFDDLANIFKGDVMTASEKLPGFAAHALFLETAFEVNRLYRQSILNNSRFSEADSVRLFMAAKSYYELALDQFHDKLQRRLTYGSDVYQAPPGAYRASARFKTLCSQLETATVYMDKVGTAFSLTRSDCMFYRGSLAFVVNKPTEARNATALWLARLDSGRSRVEAADDLWRMKWYHAWALSQANPKESLPFFRQAFQSLLDAPPTEPDRGRVQQWSELMPNAVLRADLEPSFRAPSLFFAHWHKATIKANTGIPEELRVIEYSRLFDGSSPLTTAFFESEGELKKRLGGRFALKSDGVVDLESLRKAFAGQIRTASINPKATTVAYFMNISDATLYAYCSSALGLKRHETAMSVFASSIMQIDHEAQIAWASSVFLKPIWADIRKFHGSTINIVPQTFAATVPFAALVGDDGHLMVDEFPLAFQTTLITHPISANNGAKDGPKLTIVHSPVVADEKLFPPLPRAEQEAAGIISALSETPVSIEVLDGKKASLIEIESAEERSSWLHLISHGFASASDPFASGFALTPTQNNDGILTVADIIKWTRPLDLLMVATCDSGRIRDEGAFVAGLSSLPRLGIAKNVGLSLWQLNDDSGSLLMREFYERLALGMSPPLALQKAQQEVRKVYNDPDFWAPVVLYTDVPN
jgi:hypothetical protein